MNILPVVDRELRVVSRSRITHRSRFFAGLIAAFVIGGMTLTVGFNRLPSQIGNSVFGILDFLLTWFCLIGGVMTTFDSVSEERRQGTLGLLFLTPLRNIDLILGKLASASLTVFFGAIAVMPVLAITLVLGGVTMGEVWRVSVGLLMILFFAASLGLSVSSLTKDASKSLLLAFGFLTLFLVVIEVAAQLQSAFKWFSPPRLTSFARDNVHTTDPARFWQAASCIGFFSLGLLLFATRRTAHFRIDQSEANTISPTNRFMRRVAAVPKKFKDADKRETMLQSNPAVWLAASSSPHSGLLRVLIVATLSIIGGIAVLGAIFDKNFWTGGTLFAGFTINLALKLWIAVAACQSFNETRRTGELDMLLTTPLRPGEVVAGHNLALEKIFEPAIRKVLGIQAASILITFHLFDAHGGDQIANLLFLVCFFVALITDYKAMRWVGLWNGLVYPKMHVALGRTVFTVLVIPWLVVIVPCLGWILFLCSPIYSAILANRAEEKFFNHFPRIVTEPEAYKNGKPILLKQPPMPVRRPIRPMPSQPQESDPTMPDAAHPPNKR